MFFGSITKRLALAIVAALTAAPAAADEVVNVYTFKRPDLIQPALDAFTRETGIATQVLFIENGLEERVQAEGENSPADVILTGDVSRLATAKQKRITQPLDRATVSAVPAVYRDPDGAWVGLTQWARVVYAPHDRVTEAAIDYADLADPKWRGRICLRSGQHDSNLALFSAMILHWGVDRTEAWMRGLKANLARQPEGGDERQAQAIAAGLCDVALGDTDQLALMRLKGNPEEKAAARAIRVIFPSFDHGRTHVDISGAAVARYAPHPENAARLIRFLATPEAQALYAGALQAYPVVPGAAPSPALQALGNLKPDTLPLAEIAAQRRTASQMMDRVRLDAGPEG